MTSIGASSMAGAPSGDTLVKATPCTIQHIDQGWEYKELEADITLELESTTGWTAAYHFPSEIYAELVQSGVIPHPYKTTGDTEIQWVAETDWMYRTTFQVDLDEIQSRVELHFEGLDTYCTIYLNGKQLLKTDNMYIPHKCDVPIELLLSSNVLLLHFSSAKAHAKDLEAQLGVRRAGSCNLGDPSRVYSRKAQYHWRWDWGPELMAVGPYRPIFIKSYSVCIEDLAVTPQVSSKLQTSLDACITLAGVASIVRSFTASISDSEGKIIRKTTRELTDSELALGEASLDWEFSDGEIELWWPAKYGKQTLYTFEAMALDKDGTICDSQTRKVGFRRVRLIQEPLVNAPGTTFLFEVNNVRMFMGGSNWIPADYMLTTISPDRYRSLLQAAVDGNQNMIRVWSGGIYEPPVFYETCDELGILVWQDFVGFACGVYPAHTEYVEQVTTEAESAVKLLRHHPCIVIWCGNNEDYQQILQWGEAAELPARIFYEEIFPDIIRKYVPETPYWFGSPYGGKDWWETSDLTVGDVHEWHIWCNVSPGEYYQNYDILAGRFVSEFGLPAFPNKPAIDYWLQDVDEAERHPQSQIMAHHCRAGSFERRFAVLMNENFRMSGDLSTYAFLTQLMQSEGLGWAYRSWRRRWQGPGRQYTAGALVWQLNDAWPVTSWALIDYFGGKKPAYYTIARELAPVTVGLARTIEKNKPNDRPRQFYEFGAFQNISATLECWVSNLTLDPIAAKLELSYYDLKSGVVYHSSTQDLALPPNQSTDVFKESLMPPPLLSDPTQLNPIPASRAKRYVELDRTHTVIVHALLTELATGRVLARMTNWPEPYKYLKMPDPELVIVPQQQDGIFTLEVKAPAKCVFLSIEGEGVDGAIKWSDNALDLFPGDPQTVQIGEMDTKHSIMVSRLGAEVPVRA